MENKGQVYVEDMEDMDMEDFGSLCLCLTLILNSPEKSPKLQKNTHRPVILTTSNLLVTKLHQLINTHLDLWLFAVVQSRSSTATQE